MCIPGLFGGAPQPPAPPAPPPPPPAPPAPPTRTPVSQAQQTASSRQRSLLGAQTKGGTILTGPSGIQDEETKKSAKQLLGN